MMGIKKFIFYLFILMTVFGLVFFRHQYIPTTHTVLNQKLDYVLRVNRITGSACIFSGGTENITNDFGKERSLSEELSSTFDSCDSPDFVNSLKLFWEYIKSFFPS